MPAPPTPHAAFAPLFDEDGRRVLDGAVAEARALGHGWIGTEHLLLGLLRDREGAGGRTLRRLGIGLDETRAAVAFWVAGMAPRDRRPPPPVVLAPRAARTLREAVAAAAARPRLLDAARQGALAGQEDLLPALLRGEDDGAPGRGVAAALFAGFGVTAEAVEVALRGVLAEDGTEPPHPYRLAVAGHWVQTGRALARWRERWRDAHEAAPRAAPAPTWPLALAAGGLGWGAHWLRTRGRRLRLRRRELAGGADRRPAPASWPPGA